LRRFDPVLPRLVGNLEGPAHSLTAPQTRLLFDLLPPSQRHANFPIECKSDIQLSYVTPTCTYMYASISDMAERLKLVRFKDSTDALIIATEQVHQHRPRCCTLMQLPGDYQWRPSLSQKQGTHIMSCISDLM
jgi:hypothetical protein